MTRPRLRYALAVVLVLAAGGAAIRLADRQDRRVDWTANGRFTPDWVARAALAGVPGDVRATAYPAIDAGPGAVAALRLRLEGLGRASSSFTYRIADPRDGLVTASAERDPRRTTVVLATGDRREIVDDPDEAGLVAGLIRLSRRGARTVVFLGGHGERAPDDASPDGMSGAADDLRRAGFPVGGTLWVRDDASGPEAGDPSEAILVLAGPRTDLFPTEVDRLERHLARGGAVLVLVDPRPLPRLEAWLVGWGVRPGPGVLVDPATRLYGADATVPVVTDYARHPVTESLTRGGTVPTFFPVARALHPVPPSSPRRRVEVVASAGGRAREQSLDGSDASPGDTSPAGAAPPAVAVAAEGIGGARILVIGDSDFAANGNLALSGNAALFAGAIEWLSAGDDPLPVPPSGRDAPLLLTQRQFRQRVTVPALAIPLLLTCAGAGAARRKRT